MVGIGGTGRTVCSGWMVGTPWALNKAIGPGYRSERQVAMVIRYKDGAEMKIDGERVPHLPIGRGRSGLMRSTTEGA